MNAQDPTNRPQVSVGTVAVAIELNGLGESLRNCIRCHSSLLINRSNTCWNQESRLRGESVAVWDAPWIDCTPTISPRCLRALRAECQIFGIKAQQIHIDITSFSVSGAYTQAGAQQSEEEEGATSEGTLIAITYNYSRDHRANLKQ